MATISHDKVGCTESGNTILKNIGQVNFEFLKIHRCPEEAKIGLISGVILTQIDIVKEFCFIKDKVEVKVARNLNKA